MRSRAEVLRRYLVGAVTAQADYQCKSRIGIYKQVEYAFGLIESASLQVVQPAEDDQQLVLLGRAPDRVPLQPGQAADVLGYLAMLDGFVAELEPEPYRRETLRGLIGPEVGPSAFAVVVSTAEAEEQRCRAE